MKWEKIDNYIHLNRMLWFHVDGSWFGGTFVNDSEYGECVRTDEDEYIPIDRITHYMIINKPT